MRLVACVFLLLIASPALAQAPEPYTLTVTAGDVVPASIEAHGEAVFTISFESQNPFDAQNARNIRIDVSGASPGWTHELSVTHVQLMSGEQARVVVEVSVNAGADAESSEVRLTATLVPYSPQEIPVIGASLDPATSDDATATVERSDSTTRAILEGLGGWIYAVLAAVLVLIVIVTKFVIDGRKLYVALEAGTEEVHVAPGKAVAVPLTVRNLGRNEDTVVFHVMTVSEGWSASLPVPELDLDGGAEEHMQIIVRAPKTATPGEVQTVGVTAHSGAAPRRVAEAVVRVTVDEKQPQ